MAQKVWIKKMAYLFLFLIANLAMADEIDILKVNYGKSESGKDLFAFIHFKPEVELSKFILVTEGIHGNEYLGLLEKISKQLRKNELDKSIESFFENGGILITVPRLNIDGVLAGSRFNSKGHDINRTFMQYKEGSLQSIEARSLTQFVKDFIDKTHTEFVFAMDIHCCGGAVLKPKEIKSNESFYHLLESTMNEELGKDYIMSNTAEFFGKRFVGTLKDYWSKAYAIPSVTFEALNLLETHNYKSHLRWWGKYLSYWSNEKKTPLPLAKGRPSISVKLRKLYSE